MKPNQIQRCNERWTEGVIKEVISPLKFLVSIRNVDSLRHLFDLRPRSELIVSELSDSPHRADDSPSDHPTTVPVDTESVVRERRPPTRFQDYVSWDDLDSYGFG